MDRLPLILYQPLGVQLGFVPFLFLIGKSAGDILFMGGLSSVFSVLISAGQLRRYGAATYYIPRGV
ncbi:hypothetical protein [Bradyrhizobium sp. cf659]|uniref:hypothetical protein n=1 Tax=Bradyrhizobium sp. cf659 TaxID=1761771 RepID=UPI0008DEBC81|nr:hypothetical protein [Bradyrhizobium sp. cf659]SFI87974.1 hypothetical protein SAMN04487925_104110 [Bradyrhizobium sp. cf659]